MNMKFMFSRVVVFLALVFTVFGLYTGSAFSQSYPTKPITIICPWLPGSGNDIVSRIIAEPLSKKLSQPVVVENKAGASGAIGTELVAKAAPDGYTLLNASTTLGINMSLTTVHYDLVKDFAPVAIVATTRHFLAVSMSLPVKSIKELVELAKSKPGQINFGSSGIGGAPHLCGEIFKLSNKIDIVHVPYKGTAIIIPDLLEGRVHFMFTSGPSTVIPYYKAGRLRILGVAGDKRYPDAPEVPTFVEAGFPSLNVSPWFGFVAPAGTPKGTVAKLNTEITKILGMSDVKERLIQSGFEPSTNTPEECAVFIKEDVARWAKVIKDSGIPVQ